MTLLKGLLSLMFIVTHSFGWGTEQTLREWSIPYSIDQRWAPDNRTLGKTIQLVKEASLAWSQCGAHFQYTGRSLLDKEVPIFRSQGPSGPQVGFAHSLSEYDASALGVTLREIQPHGQVLGWRMMLLNTTEMNTDLLYSVALHEFGHTLGLDHSTNPKSVMYPVTAGRTIHLHAEDITACKTLLNAWTDAGAKMLGATIYSNTKTTLSINATH